MYNRSNLYYIIMRPLKMDRNHTVEKDGFCAKPFSFHKKYLLQKRLNKTGSLVGWAINTIARYPDTMNPYIYTHLRGGTMKIKYDRFEEITRTSGKGSKYKVVTVHGKAIGGKLDGQDYSCTFFANNKELRAQVEDLTKGSTVEITMTKKDKFWNPTKFEMVPADEAPQGGSGVGDAPTGAPVNQRFENLKLAADIIGTKLTDQDSYEYLTDAASLADMIQDYIDKKGAFQFDNTSSDEIPDENVGEVEEDY